MVDKALTVTDGHAPIKFHSDYKRKECEMFVKRKFSETLPSFMKNSPISEEKIEYIVKTVGINFR